MQSLAAELGVEETVVSPTFVVMKKYATEHQDFAQLVHIDAYRIEAEDEMRPLRFSEELQQADSLIGIEWAERIKALLPAHTMYLSFEITDDARVITLSYGKEN